MTSTLDLGSKELADRFGTYVLPGRVADPERGIIEAREAERIGLGTVWISERYAVKEPAVLSGAVSQATSRIKIAATMYATVRHPIVTASVANLMQALSGDRFRLLLARGFPSYMAAIGSPPITFPRLADCISILRRLWAGETVSYDGVLGKFPSLVLTDRYEGAPPPIILTATGPKALAFAGAHCDGVLLHPFVTAQGVRNSVKIVRDAAARVGRDPDSVRIIHTIVVAPDLPRAEEEAVVGGRAVTYFQIPVFGEMIAEINGWDMAVLDKLRVHSTFAKLGGQLADQAFTKEQLVDASRTLPDEWLRDGAAVGSAAQCANQLMEFLDAGADEILLHGSAPAQMGPLTAELRRALGARAGGKS